MESIGSVSIKVEGDISSITRQIKDLQGKLDKKIKLDVDNIGAISKVDALSKRLEIAQANAVKIGSKFGIDSTQFQQASLRVGELKTRISDLNSVEVSSPTLSINRFTDALKGSIVTIAKVGAAIGALGAGFTIAQIFKAGEVEQTGVAYKVLVGNAELAKETLKDLVKFADVTPFETKEVLNAGKALLGYGISAKEVRGVLQSTGDIASGLGIPIQELATLYGKARTQNTLYTQDIKELANRGVPIYQELAKQFGVSEEAINDLASNGQIKFANLQQAFASLTGEGGQFFGLMNAQSQTFLGRISTLKSVLATRLGNAVGVLSDGTVVKGGLFDTVSEQLNKLINDGVIEKLGMSLKTIIDTLVNAGSAVFNFISTNEGLKNTLSALGGIVVSVASFIGGLIEKFFAISIQVANFIANSEPFKALLGSVRDLFSENAERLNNLINSLSEGSKTVDILSIALGALDIAYKGLKIIVDSVNASFDLFAFVVETAKTGVSVMLAPITSAIDKFGGLNNIVNNLKDTFYAVRDAVYAVRDALDSSGILDSIKNAIGGPAIGLLSSLPGFSKGGMIKGYAQGGSIVPQGDEFLIGARAGEFMMQERAVNKYGTDFMNKINNLQLPTIPTQSASSNRVMDVSLGDGINITIGNVNNSTPMSTQNIARNIGFLLKDNLASRGII